MPNHTEETLKQALKSKKARITFFKDEDINRFNEHIRNYTGKNFSQEDFEKLNAMAKASLEAGRPNAVSDIFDALKEEIQRV